MYSADCEVLSEILVPAVRFNRLEFDAQIVYVTSCFISIKDSKTITTEIKVKGLDVEEIEGLALSLTRRVLYRLEGCFGLLTGNSKCVIKNVKDESGGTVILAYGSAMLPSCGSASITTERSAEEIRSIIEAPTASRDIYLELYHHARVAKNPTVQFLGYYQIVAALLGDPAQKVIDKFFAENDPSMPPFTPNPVQSGRIESVYTRLRNEVAHVRPRTGSNLPKDPIRVHAEIAQYCDRLSQLARTAIDKLA